MQPGGLLDRGPAGGLLREPVAKTSGAKGLQVYVSLPARTGWDAARERALWIAQAVEKDHPGQS